MAGKPCFSMTEKELFRVYQNRRVLITGGLGFIGSNLAQVLVRQAGARVCLIDNEAPHCGSNIRNLDGIEKDAEVLLGDIGDADLVRPVVRNVEIIFNLAGSISHIDSMTHPHQDLHANAGAHLSLLDTCRRENPGVRILYAGTRQVYGRPCSLPVDESHPACPVDFNGVHKLLGEGYHFLYASLCGLRPTCLRLTNTYGPRQLLHHPRQGFVGWFIRQALLGEELQLFGGGHQLRDFNFVDDVVAAMLLAAVSENAIGKIYNLGSGAAVSIRNFVETLLTVCPGLTFRDIDFPSERRSIDIGSYYADCSRIRADLGWEAATPLEEGLRKTLHFYRDNRSAYMMPR